MTVVLTAGQRYGMTTSEMVERRASKRMRRHRPEEAGATPVIPHGIPSGKATETRREKENRFSESLFLVGGSAIALLRPVRDSGKHVI